MTVLRALRRRAPLLTGAAGAALVMTALAGCASTPPDADAVDGAEGADRFAIDRDFPDPDILRTDDGWTAYATNAPGSNVQTATSKDLVTWEAGPDALPALPSWTAPGKTWAPEVTRLASGSYVMYLTADTPAAGAQCISVATSPSPSGPFVAAGDGPLVCPEEEGGAIDASTVTDSDGTLFLVWKNDGNCCGLDTWIQLAPLSADGLSLTGAPTRIVMQTEPWEGNLVEAPVIVAHDGRWVLFYSANDYGGGDYATGYATADSLLGPWTKGPEPLMTTDASGGLYVGPGGADAVETEPGAWSIVFHSWADGLAYRGVSVLPLSWDGDRPEVTF